EPSPPEASRVVLAGRATRVPYAAVTRFPRSTSGSQEPHRPSVFGWVVGDAVLPDAPEHPDPGAGQDAHGVGVVAGALDRLGIDRGRPGGGVAGVIGEVEQRRP